MKNWKKLLTLVLAMVLCLSISACGGDSGDGGETADAPAVLEDYAYDSAADASGYDAYIGNWVGTGDAENDTLEVTTTDGGSFAIANGLGTRYSEDGHFDGTFYRCEDAAGRLGN